jgi:hypothetical protein
VATTLRQEEICKPEWPLVDMKKRLVVIQDRKDPRNKAGNDQKVPLLNLTGYHAWEVVLQQRIVTRGYGRIFPHNHNQILRLKIFSSCSTRSNRRWKNSSGR